MASTLVELDSRRRLPLGRIGRKQDTRYLAEAHPDGTIVLHPAIVMTEREAEALANPELIAQLANGIAEAHAGNTQPLDWSQFNDPDDAGG